MDSLVQEIERRVTVFQEERYAHLHNQPSFYWYTQDVPWLLDRLKTVTAERDAYRSRVEWWYSDPRMLLNR